MDIDIEYVAGLARIELSAKEKKKLGQDLGDILSYIEKLKELDVGKVEPMSHVLPLKNVFRQDKLKDSLSADQAVANAPARKNSFFSVPRVIE